MQKPDRGVHKGTSLCVCCDSPICLILILISWRDAIINKHGGTASKGNKVLLSLSGDLSEYLFFDMLTQNMCKWGTYWPSSVCVEYSWKCCVYARDYKQAATIASGISSSLIWRWQWLWLLRQRASSYLGPKTILGASRLCPSLLSGAAYHGRHIEIVIFKQFYAKQARKQICLV